MSYIVWRKGAGGPETPYRLGDEVTTYELEEPSWPYADFPLHSGHTQALEEYQEAVLQYANTSAAWRVQEELHCDCQQRRAVAQVLVHTPSKRLWVTAKPERIPAVFRTGGKGVVEGWPLHGQRGEAPHVGAVASCKGCDRRWLVVSFVDGARLLRITAATHGAKLAP